MQQALNERGDGRLNKQTINHLRSRFWPCLKQEMNRCLLLHQIHFDHQQNIRLSTTTFNQFLKFIVGFRDNAGCADINGSSLQLIDEYYLLAKQVGIHPDSETFNILLRANRVCHGGVRGKLAVAHLNEMAEYGIPADSFTTVELLAMCAKCPQGKTMSGTMTNKQVADAEFEYYLKFIMVFESERFAQYGEKKVAPYVVFNAYLNVYVKDRDFAGMHQIFDLAERYRICIYSSNRAERRNRLAFHIIMNRINVTKRTSECHERKPLNHVLRFDCSDSLV